MEAFFTKLKSLAKKAMFAKTYKLMLLGTLLLTVGTVIFTIGTSYSLTKFVRYIVKYPELPAMAEDLGNRMADVMAHMDFTYFMYDTQTKTLKTDLNPQPYYVVIPQCKNFDDTKYYPLDTTVDGERIQGLMLGCDPKDPTVDLKSKDTAYWVINTKGSDYKILGGVTVVVTASRIEVHQLKGNGTYKSYVQTFDSKDTNVEFPYKQYILLNDKNPALLTRLPDTLKDLLKADLLKQGEYEVDGVLVWPVSLLGEALKQSVFVLQKFIEETPFTELFYAISIFVGVLALFETLAYVIAAFMAIMVIAFILWVLFKLFKEPYDFGKAFNLTFGAFLGVYIVVMLAFMLKALWLAFAFGGPVTSAGLEKVGNGVLELLNIYFYKWYFKRIGLLLVAAFLGFEVYARYKAKKAA